MTLVSKTLGMWGEEWALAYLIKKGYRLVARNVRAPFGEIDLIVWEGRELVCVEVKTRRNLTFGPPEASITPTRRKRLFRCAQWYALRLFPQTEIAWRVDVIALVKKGETVDVHHVVGIDV